MPCYGDDILSKVVCDPVALFDQYQQPIHHEAKPDYQAERDEAREVARDLLEKLLYWADRCGQNTAPVLDRWHRDYPWLKEQS